MSYLGNYRPRQYQVLVSEAVVLRVRQHPKYAVITPENKEKMRKPVDPPPIVQLIVDRRHDVGSNYLVNPFLFMTASLVEPEEQEDGSFKPVSGDQIIGQNVSSLHRLKDIDNKDGGFFVFGDISCRHTGQYRLQFNLFDLEKDNNQVVFVESVVSEPFRVVSQKEFRGLSESTHLSRTFSDQGVRLRLRKEPRTITGSKRGWENSPLLPSTSSPMHQSMYSGPPSERSFGYEATPFKRPRSDSDHTNPYSYPPSQYSGSAVSHTNSNLSAGSPWPAHQQQSFPTDQSPSLSGLPPQYYPHSAGYTTSYQRPYQQGTYSAPPMSANPYFSNANAPVSMPRNQTTAGYPPQTGQQYDSRINREVYQTPQGIQVAIPTSSSAIASIQSHSFLSSSTEISTEAADVSSGTAQPHQSSQPQQMHGSAAQYGYHSMPMHPSSQVFQQPHPDAQGLVYNQPGQSQVPKYEQSHYQRTPDMYSDPSREQFPQTTAGALSDASLSLDAGMLNRSFAPPQATSQQAPYDDPDLTGYKQQPGPYPTPNRTSPMG